MPVFQRHRAEDSVGGTLVPVLCKMFSFNWELAVRLVLPGFLMDLKCCMGSNNYCVFLHRQTEK